MKTFHQREDILICVAERGAIEYHPCPAAIERVIPFKFIGQRVKECAGSSKVIDPKALCGQKLLDHKSWGKYFLLIFERQVLKVHFLLFGSYRIDDPRPGLAPRLSLRFKKAAMSGVAPRAQCYGASGLFPVKVSHPDRESGQRRHTGRLGAHAEAQPRIEA